MRRSCVVCGYKTSYNQHRDGKNYSMFGFPMRDRKRVREWADLLGIEDFEKIDRTMKVCEQHFKKEYIVTSGQRRDLALKAVPSKDIVNKPSRNKPPRRSVAIMENNNPDFPPSPPDSIDSQGSSSRRSTRSLSTSSGLSKESFGSEDNSQSFGSEDASVLRMKVYPDVRADLAKIYQPILEKRMDISVLANLRHKYDQLLEQVHMLKSMVEQTAQKPLIATSDTAIKEEPKETPAVPPNDDAGSEEPAKTAEPAPQTPPAFFTRIHVNNTPEQWKLPPPAPILGLCRNNNGGIDFLWRIKDLTAAYAKIVRYTLAARSMRDVQNDSRGKDWQTIGEIEAKELPMECTVSGFPVSNSFMFAIRATDEYARCGPYSNVVYYSNIHQ